MNQSEKQPLQVGIDDMAAYVPHIYLPIEDLADARNIEYAKLNKGLGLTAMAVPDLQEDTATLAANAVYELIRRNDLDPTHIGRIYMGTESSFDGSKPMASYVLQMLSEQFESDYGRDCFLHCDVVDLTFACIGAVDALQNTMDWVRADEDRIGIVVASDIAWYDLGSTGEYTQGAGAVALLVKANPRLLAVDPNWGVASQPVYDFFKPVRKLSKAELVEELVSAQGKNGHTGRQLYGRLMEAGNSQWANGEAPHFILHSETPVFDGPYSNQCYQDRIAQALDHFSSGRESFSLMEDWDRLIFHLPYAFQARRMFTTTYLEEKIRAGDLAHMEETLGQPFPKPENFEDEPAYQKARSLFLKALSKSDDYRRFVQERIEKGERASSLVGNLYTGSIWMSLMSSLEADLAEENEVGGQTLGFFAYGSGSKSKVFQGEVQSGASSVIKSWHLMDRLQKRKPISFEQYVKIRKDELDAPLVAPRGIFQLTGFDDRKGDTYGTRTYAFRPVAPTMAPA
jgi:hydroxymethylglutaryl-CoA synthase